MTKEEKQILLKDLCARLPYGVKVHLGTDDKNFDTDLVGLTSNITVNIHNIENYETIEECFIWNIKPCLRPLSSMTEEEFKMVCSMNALTDTELRDRINFPNMFVKSYTIETFDLFNSHHFDYRGLISMGLALEASEDMYKTE